jgi:hypothetical protein
MTKLRAVAHLGMGGDGSPDTTPFRKLPGILRDLL